MEHDEALDRAWDGYGNSRGLKEFSGDCGGGGLKSNIVSVPVPLGGQTGRGWVGNG